MLIVRETNEGKAPRTPRVAIGRDVNIDDFAHLGEQLAKLLIRGAEVEITYEYLV